MRHRNRPGKTVGENVGENDPASHPASHPASRASLEILQGEMTRGEIMKKLGLMKEIGVRSSFFTKHLEDIS